MNTVNVSIQDYLAENEFLVYRFSGVSMRPMLRQEKDVVILRRYDGKGLHKYDVALYNRGDPRGYVLHRVIEVHEGYYVFLGDNCLNKEKRIPESSIIAVMDYFVRDGKKISVQNLAYRAYVHIHCALFPVRALIKKARMRIVRNPLLRKIYHLLSSKQTSL